jgi:hypothetical protein
MRLAASAGLTLLFLAPPTAAPVALSAFFAFGALMAGATAGALAIPQSPLRHLWRLNPPAHAALLALGPWAAVVMAVVSGACGAAAVGLWTRAEWGRRTAVAVLSVNLVGDVANAVVRGDLRPLIGVPIAAGLIAYLASARVRAYCRGMSPDP